MKRIVPAIILLALAGCTSAAEQRTLATKEAEANSQECHSLTLRGMRARCLGEKMLEADNAHGVNPKYDIQRINGMIEIEDGVDKGAWSQDDANQRLKLLLSEVSAIERSDAIDRARANNAAAGAAFAAGMQNASNAFKPTYQTPRTCTTMPLGAGQFTTHCY